VPPRSPSLPPPRQAIYLNRDSGVVQKAIHGRDLDIAILATVIRHEQQHLRGANEQDARRAERDFFRSPIQGGRVPVDEGVAYPNILQTHYGLREGARGFVTVSLEARFRALENRCDVFVTANRARSSSKEIRPYVTRSSRRHLYRPRKA
jgi:hypothetical protein